MFQLKDSEMLKGDLVLFYCHLHCLGFIYRTVQETTYISKLYVIIQ